jgi:hypothetical protein
MRISLLAIAVLLGTSFAARAADASPKFTEVTPMTGKAGAEFTVTGENLAKEQVAEVYFTDGKKDMKCEIVDQQTTTIKVKAPAEISTGRFSLMILTADRTRFLESPSRAGLELPAKARTVLDLATEIGRALRRDPSEQGTVDG